MAHMRVKESFLMSILGNTTVANTLIDAMSILVYVVRYFVYDTEQDGVPSPIVTTIMQDGVPSPITIMQDLRAVRSAKFP